MSTRPNFSKTLLDDAPDHVERPKPLPIGTYLAVVGRWETGESSKKKTPYVRFPLRFIQAYDDVDLGELFAAGGVEGKSARTDFYMTEDSIYRLDAFHEHCGVDLSVPVSRKQRNEEVLNAQVGVVISHRYPVDAEGNEIPDSVPFAEVSRTFAA